MEEIMKFLTSNPAFFVATVDEKGHPKVRPFSFVMEWNGKITLMTSRGKSIFRQLENNPNIEICSYNPEGGQWVRITGKVSLFSDVDASRKVFEVMPSLRPLYRDEYNPDIACVSITGGEAAFYDFTKSYGEPVKVIRL